MESLAVVHTLNEIKSSSHMPKAEAFTMTGDKIIKYVIFGFFC